MPRRFVSFAYKNFGVQPRRKARRQSQKPASTMPSHDAAAMPRLLGKVSFGLSEPGRIRLAAIIEAKHDQCWQHR
jgi:hypothetical protein